MQHQRHPRILTQPRMAAGEHHAQLIVLDRVRLEDLVDGRHQRPLALDHPRQLRRIGPRGPLPPQNVDRAMLRRCHQPRRRVRRHAAELPHLDRAAEGVLDHVFCQREVVHPEESRQCDHHPPRLVPEQLRIELRTFATFALLVRLHYMFICRIGRTSTAPLARKIGQPFDASTASSMSFAVTSV